MKTIIAALAVAACLACPAIASANVYKVSFTARDFNSSNGSVPLQDPVAGSILYSRPSPGYGTPSVLDIDLTIGRHTYTVDEIGTGTAGGGFVFGATISGLDDLLAGTDGFYFHVGGRDEQFAYASAERDGIWGTRVLSLNTEEVASVPEPGSLALLLIGAGAVGAMRRRRSPANLAASPTPSQ